MKFKTDNLYLYVEGIQFLDGLYETTKEDEIEILKRYSDSVSIVEEKETIIKNDIEEEKPSKAKKTEE